MDETVIIKGTEVEILTGCGPGGLGWGTGIWIGGERIFAWDWSHEDAAMDGHTQIKSLLQTVADALRQRPLDTFDTAYLTHY